MQRRNQVAEVRGPAAAADLAHILAIGMAETGLSLQKSCHHIGISRATVYALSDRHILPALPIVAAIAAAYGWRTTVVMREVQAEPLVAPRASDIHVAFLVQSPASSAILQRLSRCDPALGVMPATPPAMPPHLGTLDATAPTIVQKAVARTVRQYIAAVGHVLMRQLADRNWSLGALAERAGLVRSHVHAALASPNGPSLQSLAMILEPLGLRAQVVYTRFDQPEPHAYPPATAEHLRAMRCHHGSSLQVLLHLVPARGLAAAWPTDAQIRAAAARCATRRDMRAQLHVPDAWLHQQMRRLGLIRTMAHTQRPPLSADERAARRADVLASASRGEHYASIGRRWGITRERVRQLLGRWRQSVR